jgi:putative NADH-flavin reductase
MQKELHVVLGSNGAIGKAVVKELEKYPVEVRQVSKKDKIEKGYYKADLTDLVQTRKALEGASVVYQFDSPYILDDSKFKKMFPDFLQTPFNDAMRTTILSFKTED